MSKKKVSVQIEGRSYALITPDDAKYVHSVANEVTKNIRATAQSSKQLDTRDCAILAALNFCDDRNKAIKRTQEVVDKADKIIKQTNDLNKMCSEYKSKLTEAINDNTVLVKKIKELEAEVALLKNENESLKKESKSLKTEAQKNNSANKTNLQNSATNNAKLQPNQTSKMPNNLQNQPVVKNSKDDMQKGFAMQQCSLFEDNKNE